MRKKLIRTFIAEDPERVLKEVADVLNRGSQVNERLDSAAHARLLRVVTAWKDSGPNLFKMKVREDDDAQINEMWKAYTCGLSPTHSGGAYIYLSPTGEKFRDIVAFYFIRLIINPLWQKLGGPCPNCGQWFVKKTMRESVFCSRGCAGNAVKARARAKVHKQTVQRAMQAIRNYKSRPTRFRELDWKEYVSQAEGVSKKWLTRAVNRGELVPPKEGSHAKS